MNTRNKIIMAALFLICCLFANNAFSSQASKQYFINSIKINAEIWADGSLHIDEARTYNFRGRFSWADYNLPLQKLGAVNDFSLHEKNNVYVEGNGKQPGTYQQIQDEDRFYVKWFYQAKNESRTFILNYRIKQAAIVHNDIAEFYFKFVGADQSRSADSVRVSLKLPQFADTTHVRAWLHTSLNGEYRFKDGFIEFWVNPLPRKCFFETRVIFPVAWIPEASKFSQEAKLTAILTEEKELVEQTNALRQKAIQKEKFKTNYSQAALEANIILVVLGLALFLFLYQKFGQAHDVHFRGKISSEIPTDISPALANYIFSSQQTNAGAMVATMMDLAQRGFFKIEEKRLEKKAIFHYTKREYALVLDREKCDTAKSELAPHETNLINFLFDELAIGGSAIHFDEIKKAGRRTVKWFRQWKKLLKYQWGDKPFYDKVSLKGTVIAALFAVLIIAGGFVTLFLFGSTGLIGVIGGLLLLDISFLIIRYTKEAKLAKTKLNALRRYLMKYEFRRDSGALVGNFQKYFIFGVALGIGTKAIKELTAALPDWQEETFFPWYVSSQLHGSPMDLAESVSTLVAATSATMASAAGIGGGATAGGGGGAGGASGGAG